MIPISPVLLKDFYKVGHKFQYPPDTTLVYSNMTPRSSRVEGVNKVVVFGPQYFALEYLLDQFNENFFDRPIDLVLKEYRRRIENAIGPLPNYDHIANLHRLGYLPLHIKSLPEGQLCPLRVPYLTIRNTHPDFYWLTNMVESLMSCVLWPMVTSATTAFHYRQVFEKYAQVTGADKAFVKWQGHDFSFRGMMGPEAAMMSGAAHLLSFTGTDSIPAIDFLEAYYGAECERELIGGSVPATEHSVMCVGEQAGELDTIQRLITQVYPKGIVSIVSDTWDFWQVLTKYLPMLKDAILARDGKVVIRPDSGDPVKIICGEGTQLASTPCVFDGAIETLWKVFGGTINKAGFKELDPHIGLIYGDSITPERQLAILEGLRAKGFASSNVVLGIGSYTYQHVTRDTYGQAMKATYCETTSGGPQDIFKKPLTDDGQKNSAKGLLCVEARGGKGTAYLDLHLREGVSWADESLGILQTIFLDGSTPNLTDLAEIRQRIEDQL